MYLGNVVVANTVHRQSDGKSQLIHMLMQIKSDTHTNPQSHPAVCNAPLLLSLMLIHTYNVRTVTADH